MKLIDLGWSHFFQLQIPSTHTLFTPARVVRQDSNQYHLLTEAGAVTGTLPGRFRQEALSKADLPTVGDWVLTSPIEGAEAGNVQVELLLERKSKFSRKEAGEAIDEQVVAANIDTVFIVSALDDDFNPNRIERYLLLSWNSGALPVLILNKSDLCDDLETKLEVLSEISKGAPVHTISATEDPDLSQIRQYVTPGSTCTFLGSSGVGKSTIINALLGFDKFETGAVREDDGKGRHTTTFRELVIADNGGMIIDTPGMREIQLWADSASLARSFDDIESLAVQCKFRDCGHESEPGCAITSAINKGEVSQERLDRYFKLRREIEHFDSQQDVAVRTAKKQERKRFSKLIRRRPDKRD